MYKSLGNITIFRNRLNFYITNFFNKVVLIFISLSFLYYFLFKEKNIFAALIYLILIVGLLFLSFKKNIEKEIYFNISVILYVLFFIQLLIFPLNNIIELLFFDFLVFIFFLLFCWRISLFLFISLTFFYIFIKSLISSEFIVNLNNILLIFKNNILVFLSGIISGLTGNNIRNNFINIFNIEKTISYFENFKLIESVFEKTGELIYFCDLDSGDIKWFGAIEKLTGYNKEYFQKVNFEEWENMIHPDDRERVVKYLEYCKTNDLPFYDLYRFKTKDNSYINVRDNGAFIKDNNKIIMIGTMSDMTQLLKVNSEIQENIMIMNNLIESLPEALLLIDNEGKIILSNKNVSIRFNLNNDEIRNKYFKEVFINNQKYIDIYNSAIREKKLIQFEDQVDNVYYQNYFQPILDTDGNVDKVIFMSINITDRKNYEKILQENQDRISRILDLSPEAIIILDINGYILDCNKRSLDLFGYSDIDEVKNKYFIDFFSDNYKDKSKLDFEKLLKDSYIKDTDAELKKKNGEILYGLITAFVINEDSNSKKIIAYLRDITEQKKLQEMEIELQKKYLMTQKLESLKILSSGIAHDFNNILMIISGNISILGSFINKNTRYYDYIIEINNAIKRANVLTDQLLSYCGCGNFNMKGLNISNAIDFLSQSLKNSVPKNIELKLDLEKNIPLIYGDLINIQHIVITIYNNSIEAIGQNKGTIEIKTGVRYFDKNFLIKNKSKENLEEGEYVFIQVYDNGCGIDENEISKIFDPFYSTKEKGRGLGLSGVLGIINYHKGGIVVESEKNKGTTFTILFPIIKEVGEKNMENENKSNDNIESEIIMNNKSKKILIVDDEEAIAKICEVMLKYLGYNPITTNSGHIALRLILENKQNINIVLLDFTMPDIDGNEILKEIKITNPHIKVIITSGYPEETILNMLGEYKPDGFLQKPFQIENLRKILEEVLR